MPEGAGADWARIHGVNGRAPDLLVSGEADGFLPLKRIRLYHDAWRLGFNLLSFQSFIDLKFLLDIVS